MGTDNSGDATKDKFRPPKGYVQAESEQKIKSLFEDNKLQSLIKESKSVAIISLRWGIFIIILALITLIALAFISKRDSATNANECACCNGKITCFNVCCSSYDLSIYGFMFVAIMGLGIGVILIRHYVAASKKANDLNEQYLTISELQVAWEMSKGLADWIENEPETRIEEKKYSKESKDSKEVKDESQTEPAITTFTTKGKEYSYPRQRAQQQVIETLLSRSSK
jgi:hypothetical protein